MNNIPDDFTFYSDEVSTFKSLADESGRQTDHAPDPSASDAYSRPCTLRIPIADHGDSGGESAVARDVVARALVCRSFNNRYLSVTCRTLHGTHVAATDQQTSRWPGKPVSLGPPGAGTTGAPGDREPDEERATPENETDEERAKRAKRESTKALVGSLWDKLGLGDLSRPLTGLIVVAGRTGSGKSVIARAFIERYLAHAVAKPGGRPPHLVTYEDPIEKLFADSPAIAAARGFDYTPREKQADVRNLADATRDALRQTPALFFVGETRDERDWKTLLQFAGTGHLTITTGHAGSLVETMAQILHAANARTPAERSRIAGRIAALVHLRAYEPESGTPDKVLVPAFWCRNPRSISSFTAEGLGSLLPSRSAHHSPGSYGRAHAAGELGYLRAVPELRRKAVEWDLRGE